MSVNLYDWAESLFFNGDLASKLHCPEDLNLHSSTLKPMNLKGPEPARDTSLAQKGQFKFPSLNQLQTELGTAQALHSFANHELLAIETMAYTLLLFPNTPENFQRGVISTIQDEQKHLKLYIDRMNELGLDFGELPLNDFFWKSLKSMSRPIDFVSRMSLTFEQANLDFSLQYMNIFKENEDHETAEILQTVFKDEVRHVRHGLYWFDQWRPSHSSRWEHYKEILPFPLTPQRAKGNTFSIEARKKSGLDEDFIENLNNFSSSKGRVPKLYFFWPDVEEGWAKNGYSRSAKNQILFEELSFVPAYLCLPSDLLLLPSPPEKDFLSRLKSAGIDLPETVSLEQIDQISSRPIQSIETWGENPQTLKWKKQSSITPLSSSTTSLENLKTLFSKPWSTKLLKKHLQTNTEDMFGSTEICGEVFTDAESSIQYAQKLLETHSQVVFKAPHGASGRNFLIIDSRQLLENQKRWLSNILQKQRELIVEPWLNKVFDYSMQISVPQKGPGKIHGMARFLTSERGQYLGALLGGFTTGLSQELRIFLNQKNQEKQNSFKELSKDLAQYITHEAQKLGFSGSIGVDALVYRNLQGKLKIKPIVETNCRHNMGRVVVELEKKLKYPGVGLWRIFNQKELQKQGFESFNQWIHYLKDKNWNYLEKKGFNKKNLHFLPMTNSYHGEYQVFLFWGPSYSKLQKALEKDLNIVLPQTERTSEVDSL